LGGIVFAGRNTPDGAGAVAADDDGAVGGGGDALRDRFLLAIVMMAGSAA